MPDFPQALITEDTLGPLPVLHLLGEPFVSVGERRMEVPRSGKRLLVFVALRHGRVERMSAAGSLWPVNDEARAGGNLRSALWRLRQMGVPLLDTDKFGLCLRAEVVLDVDTVDRWATRIIEGAATTAELRMVPRDVETLDLLPGWYEDWALIERERVRQRLLHALEAQSRQLACRGLHAASVEAAMVAVGAEPLRESAQRVLIEAHLAEGNWIEGRRSLEAYARLLDRELGVRPAPELIGLLERAARPRAHGLRPVTPR
ncbi:AfsR/SARP family transcriptional regulator [Streptomyces longisporoflavus]|uniref:BTAD domain-containing putative transcriptional regulator n=1 Tax=Streptomyces longisporoflavus TaxID=28044 RepID=A0ABW7QFZ3_9ACTN